MKEAARRSIYLDLRLLLLIILLFCCTQDSAPDLACFFVLLSSSTETFDDAGRQFATEEVAVGFWLYETFDF